MPGGERERRAHKTSRGPHLEFTPFTSDKFYWPRQVPRIRGGWGGPTDPSVDGKSLEVTEQRSMDTILQTIEKPPGSAGGCRSCCETHKEHGQRLQQAQNWKLQSSARGGWELATECPPTPRCMLRCSVVSNSATAWTISRQAPLSMEFSRQEYWNGLPCPLPEDLPNAGIEPVGLPNCLMYFD